MTGTVQAELKPSALPVGTHSSCSLRGQLAAAAYLLVYRPENRVVGLVLWIAPLLWLVSPVVQPFTVALALFVAHTLATSRRSDRSDIASAALVPQGETAR